MSGGDSPATDGPVLLFDGVCNLCNGTVRWLIEHDPEGQFRFASLQSEAAAALLAETGLGESYFDSLVLVDGGDYFAKSEAVLEVARRLDAPWSWAGALGVVPRPLRDLVYDVVAAARYDLFGMRDQCMVPSPEIRDRFLDGSEAVPGDAT